MAGGGIIKWKGASFANAREVRPPVLDGLEGWFYPRENADRAVINYAPGKQDGYLVGAGPIHQGYVECDGHLNFLQTPVIETSSFTWYVIARNTDTLVGNPTSPGLIGNGNGASGAYIWMDSNVSGLPIGDQRAAAYGTGGALVLSNNSIPNVNNWRMYCLVCTSTALSCYDMTSDTSATGTFSGTRVTSNRPVRLGSLYEPTTLSGKCDIAFGAMYIGAHTAAQRLATMNFANYDVSFEGIAVTG